MRIYRVLAVIAVMAAMPIAPAAAATFTVTTTADTTTCVAGNCSLRGAVMAANVAGDADTIVVPAGTFALSIGPDEISDAPPIGGFDPKEPPSNPRPADPPLAAGENDPPNAAIGDLDVLTPITFVGAGRDATIVSGSDLFRVFHVIGAQGVTFQALTIAHGRVTDPRQLGGAGIQIRNGASVTFNNVDVRDNQAISTVGGSGAGASQAGSDACFRWYPLQYRQTLFGGGIHSFSGDNTITLRHSVIENNRVEDDVFDGDCNRAPRGGGMSIGGGTVSLEDSIVRGNAVVVHRVGGNGRVNGSTGGGISIEAQNVGSVNPTHPNPASPALANGTTDCGGFARGVPVLTLTRSAVVGNAANGGDSPTGGAIGISGVYYCGPFTDVNLDNSSIVGNSSDGEAPGIATTRGNLKVNATFSTIAGNVGAPGAAQVSIAPDPWDNGMEMTLRASIIDAYPMTIACSGATDVANHDIPPAGQVAVSGRYTSLGSNVIAGQCQPDRASFLTAERFAVPGASLLAGLGGEFVPAMAPLAGSPALNLAGACALTLDGRGYPRPLGGGCDSGAAERQVGIANLSNPTISGVPAVGTTVGVDPGSWTTHRATTAYQWRRCPITGTCTDIAGATGATYAPVLIDVGGQLQVVLTAASDDDPATATATSGRSGAVLATPPTPLAPGTGPGQKPKTPAKGKPRVRAAVVSVLASGCAKGAKGCAPSVVFRLSRGAKVTITVARGKKLVYRRALAAHAGRNRIALPPRLKAGSYAVTVRSAGGSAHTLRVAIGTLT